MPCTAFSSSVSRPAARRAPVRAQAVVRKQQAGFAAGLAAAVLLASAPAHAGILDALKPEPQNDPAQAAKTIGGKVEKAVEKAEKAIPEGVPGAKKTGPKQPDLSSRFQSGGTGGSGPVAGKPQGVRTLSVN